jgi:hypothetical protein
LFRSPTDHPVFIVLPIYSRQILPSPRIGISEPGAIIWRNAAIGNWHLAKPKFTIVESAKIIDLGLHWIIPIAEVRNLMGVLDRSMLDVRTIDYGGKFINTNRRSSLLIVAILWKYVSL